MKQTFLLLTLVTALLFGNPVVNADVPNKMSYQGHLTDTAGVGVPNGKYDIPFMIYDAPIGGNLLWEEIQEVHVQNGLFSVILGSVNPLDPSILTNILMSLLLLATILCTRQDMSIEQRLPALMKQFGDGYESASKATEELLKLGTLTVPALINLCKHDDCNLRWQTVNVLGYLKGFQSNPSSIGAGINR
jgi:hypothetical protein